MTDTDCAILSNDLIISELIERVGESHSPNSARYYRVMLRRLREFNGDDRILAHKLDARFVQDFSDFLTRTGMTQSTVRQMLKFLRGQLKPLVPDHLRRNLRALFDTLDTARPAWVNRVNITDIERIINAKKLPEPLEKIRMLFIYKVLSIGSIASETDGGPLERHIQWLDSQFRKRFSDTIEDYSQRLTDPDYRQGLVTLLAYIGVKSKLTDFYEENTWIAIALHLGIETDIILSALPDCHPLATSLQHRREPSPAELRTACRRIADFLVDLKERWYAMRCLKESPEDMNSRLINNLPLGEDEMFQVFILPRESKKVRKAVGANPIEKMLFFRTYHAMAKRVKADFYKYAYVYTKGRSGEPLPISDAEMRTFMLLCRLAPDSLRSYYPDETPETDFQPGMEATVTDGEMYGKVGVIQKVSTDSYTVRMTFQGLGNISVTADIPLRFLKLTPENHALTT